jgi:hypothetical protein
LTETPAGPLKRTPLYDLHRELGATMLFGVHPLNSNSAYNWPLSRYTELVARLAQVGRVVVTGHMPASNDKGNHGGTYHLRVKDDASDQIVEGAFTEAWRRQRIGRRGGCYRGVGGQEREISCVKRQPVSVKIMGTDVQDSRASACAVARSNFFAFVLIRRQEPAGPRGIVAGPKIVHSERCIELFAPILKGICRRARPSHGAPEGIVGVGIWSPPLSSQTGGWIL